MCWLSGPWWRLKCLIRHWKRDECILCEKLVESVRHPPSWATIEPLQQIKGLLIQKYFAQFLRICYRVVGPEHWACGCLLSRAFDLAAITPEKSAGSVAPCTSAYLTAPFRKLLHYVFRLVIASQSSFLFLSIEVNSYLFTNSRIFFSLWLQN